ncbi:hypothetical protein FFV09_08555 [Saccharibacillus brassicae]|uniref:Threonylcarbamoyl-AMP synthase C-terminal domain-containing protein n=2 Tax=Saccharibacillus brassicae TaxID=2583377 RepID=A0A4Y6V5X5_SACBS|nr:hypothetical protein FFV09_08555 [Saccharibacillus brassicae]
MGRGGGGAGESGVGPGGAGAAGSEGGVGPGRAGGGSEGSAGESGVEPGGAGAAGREGSAGPGDTGAEAALGAGPADPSAAASAAEGADEAPRSPGMKYAHYAPSGRLELVLGAESAVADKIRELLAAAQARGERTGVLVFDEHLEHVRDFADVALTLGSRSDLRQAAARLYAALRRFDDEGTTYMLAEGCGEEGIGAAVMNRMEKAAGGRIHRL